MTDTQVSTRLEMRWVPVTAPNGRTHMEPRWIEVGGQPVAAQVHAAA